MAYGLHQARGEIMAFLDHDDELMPSVLSTILDDWNEHGAEGKYCGLIYRTMNPITRLPNGPSFGFGPITQLEVRNVKGGGHDELCVFDRAIITRIFTFEFAEKMCWFGPIYDKVSKVLPLLYCRDDMMKIYHRDIQSSQTNSVKVSRQMVFVYAEEFNDMDYTFFYSPLLYARYLFHLIRFSDLVHGAPITGIQLIHSWPIRMIAYAMLPAYWAIKGRLQTYPVRHRDPYPLDVLNGELEVHISPAS